MCCKVAHVIEDLRSRKANVRCGEMRTILEGFGFTIKEGKTVNHKLFFHHELKGFTSSSYDCGHGKDSLIKPPYVGKVIRVLSDYQDLLDNLERNK